MTKFYEITNKMEANPNVKKFINFDVKPGIAIDLGCGAGRDTKLLIKNNWKVIAIDIKDVSEYIKENLTDEELSRLKVIKSEIETVKLEKNNLIVANNSLSFCSEKLFNNMWKNIVESIESNGYFLGTFFGENDTWASYKKKMKFFKKQEVIDLFEKFNIIELEEIELDNKTVIGEYKHWHIYAVIAQKKAQ